MLLDNDEHYVVGFLGCLYAGLIAVPLFAPESDRDRHLSRLRAIAVDAQARCALVTSEVRALLTSADVAFGDLEIVPVETLEVASARSWQERVPRDEDPLFLQYTSGSTSAPKGVIITPRQCDGE